MNKDEINRWIGYHGAISKAMTAERTSLESSLIPVSAYILLSCVEAYRRWPEMVARVDQAGPVEDIVARAAGPGVQINPVYLWSTANIFLLGRQILTLFGMSAPDDRPERVGALLDFWHRAALAYRGDGSTQSWDAGFVTRPPAYEAAVPVLLANAVPVDDELRRRIRALTATLYQYLFLLYLDTRVGTSDIGPYPGPDGTTVIVRDFYRIGPSDFGWSDVGTGAPYQNLTAALVLRDVDVKCNDWGTSITDPEDYLERLVSFSLMTTDPIGGPQLSARPTAGAQGLTGASRAALPPRPPGGQGLRPVPLDDMEAIVTAARAAQAALYRRVQGWTIHEKLFAGGYVYFTFPKPFADAAGVTLDWSVPKESADVLPILEVYQPGGEGQPPPDPEAPWYLPMP